MAMLFNQMTVCGVGLIGGSLATLAKRHNLIGKAVGFGRTQANLDVALERKLWTSPPATLPRQRAERTW